ncbi:MAG: holo-[acyl-carrier-protein] synthase [Omnitrophica bacterium RBG_13_46_9]|nr:MAG: holo-[acyl-carrier-protein] synthase [Omnitrophica bacterium RBG_13_46_9]
MIVGTGIDIVEISRFKNATKKWGGNFLDKIFTKNEVVYSKKRRFQDQHFAARFAAKEAVLKAFGDKMTSIRNWQDIEILNDKSGKPYIRFHGSAKRLKTKEKIDKVVISMAHCRNHAVANAILLRGE